MKGAQNLDYVRKSAHVGCAVMVRAGLQNPGATRTAPAATGANFFRAAVKISPKSDSGAPNNRYAIISLCFGGKYLFRDSIRSPYPNAFDLVLWRLPVFSAPRRGL
jgi:hypothetical protein